MRQQRRRRRHLLSKQRCILMPLWCSRCDSAYTNCYFFSALLPCSLFQCASLFVSVLPTLSCLFAHFCFGRMRVADGVSIDLSKWDNSHGSATNKNEGACRENKRSMAGAQQNKQWRKLRQLIMPFSKTTCTAHLFPIHPLSHPCACEALQSDDMCTCSSSFAPS